MYEKNVLTNHPGRVVLLAAGTALMAAACATTGVNRGDFNLMSLEQEWQLGNQLEQDLAQQLDLVQDPAAQRYLDRVGQELVAETELRDRPWQFHIVRSDEINAFNVPGGHVYVNTGLVKAADTAAEFVGVLAHEVAHGAARHGTEQMSKAYGANILASVVLGEDPKTYEQILAQLAAGGTFAHFSREAEREADDLGVEYMHGAGYDPEGMANFFRELLDQRQRRPGAVEQFFASHPLTEDRISNVRNRAAKLPQTGALKQNEAAFRQFKQALGL
jgi:predicted Zn-dependent protease